MSLLEDIWNKYEIYTGFGIHRSEEALQKIIQQGTIVEEDIRKHMQLTAQIIQEEKNILHSVTLYSSYLEDLLQKFKVYSPVKLHLFYDGSLGI